VGPMSMGTFKVSAMQIIVARQGGENDMSRQGITVLPKGGEWPIESFGTCSKCKGKKQDLANELCVLCYDVDAGKKGYQPRAVDR
jgi:hypothetical protein